jgi:two-component system chemotaxis response regulator CheY
VLVPSGLFRIGIGNQQQAREHFSENTNMQALIVDDSRVLRRLLADMLRSIGFDVIEAANGSEGLDQLQKGQTPDVALVDWNMPVMNGLEFVQAVRADNRYQQLPIMMVTSETEVDRMAAALEAGATDYVMKTFGKEVIAE